MRWLWVSFIYLALSPPKCPNYTEMRRHWRLIWGFEKSLQHCSSARWHFKPCHLGVIQEFTSTEHADPLLLCAVPWGLLSHFGWWPWFQSLALSLEAWTQMWSDAEELLGSGNYKEGRGGARPCPAVREKKHEWSTRELHTGANWALISASAPLETKEGFVFLKFWKARPLSSRLSSNVATYATSHEGVRGCRFLIHRKAGDCNFGRKREEMEKEISFYFMAKYARNSFDLPTVTEVKMITSHFPMEKFPDESEICFCSLRSGAA